MDPFFAFLLMVLSFMLALRGWLVNQYWAAVFLLVPALYLFVSSSFWSGAVCLLILLAGWWYMKRFEPETRPPEND
ncbi:hypothetical protein [Oceanithermus sp.]